MALPKRAIEHGWSVIGSNPSDTLTNNTRNSLQDAKNFLREIDEALEFCFAIAAQRYTLDTEDHFLGAVARWLDQEGVTTEGFPSEDKVGDEVPRTRELKDLYVGGSIKNPYFLQLSRYTTKSGKKGYAFVAHQVEKGNDEDDLQFGEVVCAYRVEEKAPGVWAEYGIDPDPQYKLGFLAEIASGIYDYYALVIPSEPQYSPDGQRMRRAA